MSRKKPVNKIKATSSDIQYSVILKRAALVFNGIDYAVCEIDPQSGPAYHTLPNAHMTNVLAKKFKRGDDCDHFLIVVPTTFILASFFHKKKMFDAVNGMDGIYCNCTELIMQFEMSLSW